MKRPDDNHEETLTAPKPDYDRALQSAVSWLGDRYLLATPQPRLHAARWPRELRPSPTRH